MTYVILYDTGYGNAGVTGTQTALVNRAGINAAEDTVSGFPLNIQTETLNGGGQVQNETEIRNDDTLSSASPIGFKNPTLLLNCSFPADAIDNTNYKYSWLYQLFRLERTKGVKVLAFNNPGNTSDYSYNRQETLPEQYGRRYLDEPTKTIVATLTGQTEGTTPHLVGYIKGIKNVVFSAKDNLVRFTCTFSTIEDN